MIKGLHHNAYRCRDSEETRQFYAVNGEQPFRSWRALPYLALLAIKWRLYGAKCQICFNPLISSGTPHRPERACRFSLP